MFEEISIVLYFIIFRSRPTNITPLKSLKDEKQAT